LIGHAKADNRMDRCWFQGALDDALNALSCAAGYNIRWLLRTILRLAAKRSTLALSDLALCVRIYVVLAPSSLMGGFVSMLWASVHLVGLSAPQPRLAVHRNRATNRDLQGRPSRIISTRVRPAGGKMSASETRPTQSRLRPIAHLMFLSRWLQLPLYLGLILAQTVYVYHFCVELTHLVEAMFGSQEALAILVEGLGYKANPLIGPDGKPIGFEAVKGLNETIIMLMLLGFIDVVMISNLLIMVIVGGYDTFVSRVNLQNHPDQPEWLSHVNASVLKVKLATALIGISSIHLLKTFINADKIADRVIAAQVGIHVAFLLSALALAYADRLLSPPVKHEH
jgi:uncharacterized protein (TIGR00645 family)